MKKSLVLAMAMALGVTASAYAANPFSDVPAGHWAYDSLAKLADTGVIDGYPDGTFKGDETITRYEAAQITARAMAKGANVDKLAAEFASELEALGVKVAALEKNADNVKITGRLRYEYSHNTEDADRANGLNVHRLRSNLWVAGQVNDDWNYTAQLENKQLINDNAANDTIAMNRAYVTGKLGGVKVVGGRQDLLVVNGNLFDTVMDGVAVSYGKKVKVSALYGKPTDAAAIKVDEKLVLDAYSANFKYEKVWGVNAATKIGAVDVNAGYTQMQGGDVVGYNEDGKVIGYTSGADKNGIFNVGVGGNIGKLALTADYLRSNIDDMLTVKDASKTGVVIGAKYGAAKTAVPGSWSIGAKYFNQGAGTFVVHTMTGNYGNFTREGFKGYQLEAQYVFAKNILGFLQWNDLEGKESGDKSKTLWSRLQFTF